MSTKRSTAEEEKEESSERSDLSLQQGNAKRVRLTSPCETSLQDLPIELLEDILIKAVVLEVKSLKLAKFLWKVKADPVMRRLGTVCSQWSNILTTNYFRKRLYGVLEDTAQDPIRLDRLERPGPMLNVNSATTMKDEIFVLWSNGSRNFTINVYDRSDMTAPKDSIPLPDINPQSLVSSSVANCLYLLIKEQRCQGSVLRISRGDNPQFSVSALISHEWLPSPNISVTATGDLIVSRQRGFNRASLCIYNAAGSLKHELRLPAEISSIRQIIPKSNGNLVLYSLAIGDFNSGLTEIDLNGKFLRRYLTSVDYMYSGAFACNADRHGRMLVFHERPKRVVLLDSEFNTLEFTDSRLDESPEIYPSGLQYDGERNEMISISGRGPVITYRLSDA